ncbi:hypothetical protein JL721_3534 [Aureococcus anophagefferens]|nr:hypothetical protein JL721_3534 [Aureococcus anophagefferens]
MGTGRDSLEVRDPPPGPLAPAARAGSGGSDDRARVPAQTDENVVTCFIDGAATLKRARKQGLLRPVALRPEPPLPTPPLPNDFDPGPGLAAAAAPPLRPLPKIRVFPQLSEVQKARLRMKDQAHPLAPTAATQEQERNAFLERIQAEEESDGNRSREDLIHRERIRERPAADARLPALGRGLPPEDMPLATERDREILRRASHILREVERFCAGARSARVAPSPEMIWASTRAIAS